jgi:hypothetical protein
MGTTTPKQESRAVARFIEAGNSAQCASCGANVQFRARVKAQQVICNVYVDGKWDRVEHFHRDCYEEAKQPYGEADESQPLRPKNRAAATAATPAATSTAA